MSNDKWGPGGPDPDPFDELDDEFGAVRFADDDAAGGRAEPRRRGLFDDPAPGTSDTGPTDVWSINQIADAAEDDPHLGEEFVRSEDPSGRTPRLRIGEGFDEPRPSGLFDDEPRATAPRPSRRPRPQFGSRPSRSESEPPIGSADDTSAPRSTDEPDGTFASSYGSSYGGSLEERGERLAASATVAVSKYGRDMPTAVATALVISVLFIVLDTFGKPWMMAIFIAAVMAVGATEFFGRTTERGYHPVTAVGALAVGCGPLAGYAFGERGVVLTVAFAFIASSIVFITAPDLSSGPLPNMAITNLGIGYLGLLGSFGGLVMAGGGNAGHIGSDTMFITAVGVVASDVGALFLGKAFGSRPLRGWISPSKTVEGFIGGLVFCMLAVAVVATKNGTWNGGFNVFVLGLGIGLLAPIGDLVESMFKRNLDIKDFGTIIRGHGGILDRFDGFLFALPFAYYALIALEPWTVVGK
jgi:CDP-diglyceride synthetase